MNKIELLDCTLRDGGYVNGWNFGSDSIISIIQGLEKAGINIIELGFLRDGIFNPDSSNLPNAESADRLLLSKSPRMIYSAMLEAFNPYPLEKLCKHREGGIDLIRVCIWKRCMSEHMEYCKDVLQKGYRITIQPSRVEQYNDSEFIDMLKRSNDLNPFAVYVVDTWGTQYPEQICHYLELADEYLNPSIRVGYHGHNNKMQALACAKAAISMNLKRELCLDSSIMGMGRGAGNLSTEIIMEYLNYSTGTEYDYKEVVSIFNKHLRNIYWNSRWGYSMYYFLCSTYSCNPNYATYFSEKGVPEDVFLAFLESLNSSEKTIFNRSFVDARISELGVKNG